MACLLQRMLAIQALRAVIANDLRSAILGALGSSVCSTLAEQACTLFVLEDLHFMHMAKLCPNLL